MDITKMLTISTGHVTFETAELLNDEADTWTNLNLPAIYTKGEYGYMIHVPEDFLDEDEDGPLYHDIPGDLHEVMSFAFAHDCNWLCLDRDGEVLKELNYYEW